MKSTCYYPGPFNFIGDQTGWPPLLVPALIMGVLTFVVLLLEGHGFRPIEALITVLVGVIAGAFVIETFLDRPDWGAIAYHSVVPQFSGTESILLATGILGATVMRHVIFLIQD